MQKQGFSEEERRIARVRIEHELDSKLADEQIEKLKSQPMTGNKVMDRKILKGLKKGLRLER